MRNWLAKRRSKGKGPDPAILCREYLKEIDLMQLATCRNGQPWICHVWFVIDECDQIYFVSRQTRRHSQELRDNQKVACTFHNPVEDSLSHKSQSLTITGVARQLTPTEVKKPYQLFARRHPKLLNLQPLDRFVDGTGRLFFYQVIPTEMVWWDELNFPEDSRQKIEVMSRM
jgi:uncharacterized pyridoxamine 5'-phosphate oxidase family protein